MSLFAEAQGSLGVVLNGPTPVGTVHDVRQVVDIPVISTVTSKYSEIDEKIGSRHYDHQYQCGEKMQQTLFAFSEKSNPELPIIATGGPTEESIKETIEAGANAITYTPPSSGELFSRKMDKYRKIEKTN